MRFAKIFFHHPRPSVRPSGIGIEFENDDECVFALRICFDLLFVYNRYPIHLITCSHLLTYFQERATMKECSNTAQIAAIDQIACILSYNGTVLDTVLNYTILAAHVYTERTSTSPRSTAATLSCFLFVVGFQIFLCLLVGCSGISIIWCACLGWQYRRLPLWLGILDGLLLLYYAVTGEWITTVAHACAIVLGRGLYAISLYAEDSLQQQALYRPIETK
jgi:hypothetical protein